MRLVGSEISLGVLGRLGLGTTGLAEQMMTYPTQRPGGGGLRAPCLLPQQAREPSEAHNSFQAC